MGTKARKICKGYVNGQGPTQRLTGKRVKASRRAHFDGEDLGIGKRKLAANGREKKASNDDERRGKALENRGVQNSHSREMDRGAKKDLVGGATKSPKAQSEKTPFPHGNIRTSWGGEIRSKGEGTRRRLMGGRLPYTGGHNADSFPGGALPIEGYTTRLKEIEELGDLGSRQGGTDGKGPNNRSNSAMGGRGR